MIEKRSSGDALYRFGHGLSYTRFEYGTARADRRQIRAGKGVRFSVDVRNSGPRDGGEVVQLYVSRPGEAAPIRSLAGFRKIFLKAGETRRLTFDLDARALSSVDENGNRIVTPGAADIWIGGGQPTEGEGVPEAPGAALQIEITGSKTIAPF